MNKQEYIAPAIEVISVGSEDDTCGVPVFFSKEGPNVPGAKQGDFDEFDDEFSDASPMWSETGKNFSAWED